MTSRPPLHRTAAWVRRYLPAGVVGTVASVLGAAWAHQLSGSLVVAALAGAVAQAVGFAGILVGRQLWLVARSPRVALRRRLSAKVALTVVLTGRRLAPEFGPALILDLVLIRPLLMLVVPVLLGPGWIAWLLGAIAADLVDSAFAALSLRTARPAELV